jgi:hypothetical protein
MSQQAQNRKEMEALLIAKAQADESFRQALLNDPKATIQKEMGGTLPEGLQVKVVEETGDTLYLVLPAAEGELSETDLDDVAGGALNVYLFGAKREDVVAKK